MNDFQTLDVVDKELCKIHHNRIFRNWKEVPPKKGDVTLLSSSKQRKGIKAAYLELEAVAQCLKITEKVSFNIASEASYVYILSGQKLIENAKNGPFW